MKIKVRESGIALLFVQQFLKFLSVRLELPESRPRTFKEIV